MAIWPPAISARAFASSVIADFQSVRAGHDAFQLGAFAHDESLGRRTIKPGAAELTDCRTEFEQFCTQL
jgi:hypothetical protein